MDALFSFIDFDKFKKEMLEMKKTADDTKGSSDIDVNMTDTLLNENQNIDEQYASWQELNKEDKSKWHVKQTMKEFKNGYKINIW